MTEKGGNFKIKKFFNWIASFLYWLYFRMVSILQTQFVNNDNFRILLQKYYKHYQANICFIDFTSEIDMDSYHNPRGKSSKSYCLTLNLTLICRFVIFWNMWYFWEPELTILLKVPKHRFFPRLMYCKIFFDSSNEVFDWKNVFWDHRKILHHLYSGSLEL